MPAEFELFFILDCRHALYTGVGSKHMKKEWIKIIGLIICCTPTYGQLVLKNFKFDSWFGYELNNKSENTYCLLGTGFFRAPSSDSTDSLISNWTREHPNAEVIPIYTSGPVMTDSPNSKQIYCWIVDNSDTLNIILVRLGCIPGGTMQRPKTWDEMNKEERKLWHDNNKPNEQVHVDSESYSSFLDKVLKAEREAQEKKLGIWAQKRE
jgi:hypothetical protein